MCERRGLNADHNPRCYNATLGTFILTNLKFEYRREVSLINQPPKFEACGEVEVRETRVWVTGTRTSIRPARA